MVRIQLAAGQWLCMEQYSFCNSNGGNWTTFLGKDMPYISWGPKSNLRNLLRKSHLTDEVLDGFKAWSPSNSRPLWNLFTWGCTRWSHGMGSFRGISTRRTRRSANHSSWGHRGETRIIVRFQEIRTLDMTCLRSTNWGGGKDSEVIPTMLESVFLPCHRI